jgi:hypothetical protein
VTVLRKADELDWRAQPAASHRKAPLSMRGNDSPGAERADVEALGVLVAAPSGDVGVHPPGQDLLGLALERREVDGVLRVMRRFEALCRLRRPG